MDECYSKLANAVIIQAVKDYRVAYRRLMKVPKSKEAQDEVSRLERFFISPWYGTLTDVDGKILIKKIQEMERQKAGRDCS